MNSDVHLDKKTERRQMPILFGAIVAFVLLTILALGVVAFAWFGVHSNRKVTSISPISVANPMAESGEPSISSLIVLNGAIKLSRSTTVYSSHHVVYSLDEKYPSTNAIQLISSQLKSLGWKPLKNDWLNPEIESSHVRGWTDFRDRTTVPTSRVHQWSAQWQDASGNIVAYSLRYAYPDSAKPDLKSLSINGSWYPSDAVKTMRKSW